MSATWIILATLTAWPAHAAKPTTGFAIQTTDVNGGVHLLEQRGHAKPLVLVFLATECPIANGYVPTLNALYKKRKLEQGVTFYGVISDRYITRAEAAKHSKTYKIQFPTLFDASGELAEQFKPTHTPEAFVIDPHGKTVYRGRIDNTWVELGSRRRKTSQHELAEAIRAVARGEKVAVKYRKPVGCLFESPSPISNKKEAVTYSRDIAPILNAACVQCHRKGEVAPFALDSFRDAKKRAKQLARVTQSGFMPPWKPKAGIGHFRGERRLTKPQIALIKRWANSGATEGDKRDLPPSPKFNDGWKLGKPDLILKVPKAFKVPAGGPDLFRNFVIPLKNKNPKFVVAAEFRPGNRRVVHHAVLYLDNSRIARLRDKLDPLPGYGSFGGPGFVPAGDVGGWAPGYEAKQLSAGHARYVPKNSDLVVQVHYHPSGKEESDQSEVGLYFTDKPKNIAAVLTVGDLKFTIPPGKKRYHIEKSYQLPSKATLLAITPHMHVLGKAMKVTAKLPGGKVQPLIEVDDWNFDWQDQYFYKKPITLPKGTVLKVQAWYDNSSDNPLNPHSPPKPVRFGDSSTEEMMFCFFLVSKDDPRELLPLVLHNAVPVGSAMLTHYLTKIARSVGKKVPKAQKTPSER